VDVEFGPDGALYVLDFCHSPVVEAKTHQSYGRTGVL
jgi:hypothetical protein